MSAPHPVRAETSMTIKNNESIKDMALFIDLSPPSPRFLIFVKYYKSLTPKNQMVFKLAYVKLSV